MCRRRDGARGGELSYCEARVEGSDPPAFDSFHHAAYALTPGGPFAYPGKVAVLVDGLNYSAADYFPLAAKEKTGAILVGAPTAVPSEPPATRSRSPGLRGSPCPST